MGHAAQRLVTSVQNVRHYEELPVQLGQQMALQQAASGPKAHPVAQILGALQVLSVLWVLQGAVLLLLPAMLQQAGLLAQSEQISVRAGPVLAVEVAKEADANRGTSSMDLEQAYRMRLA